MHLQEHCFINEPQCSAFLKDLRLANRKLTKQIAACQSSAQSLQTDREHLEDLVRQRTSEIQRLKERLQAENHYLKQELAVSQRYGTIIGESHAVRNVTSQIELVASTRSNVLIQGESGTGKELVAREIHKHSPRSDNAFVKVNCAAIPDDLYESEFFGHVKGAFTGAAVSRVGRFETAHGGTIFLDEVGEIPLPLQSKLLRILQEGEYERVGEDRTRKVDVRIIAATNTNLQQAVAGNGFREDLFYRLNVFPIIVPPLRERLEDIPLLASHFAAILSREMNFVQPHLSQANIMDLQAYTWPGNIRELKNMIERSMILSRSQQLDFRSLLPVEEGAPQIAVGSASGSSQEAILSERDFEALKTQNMVKALEQCNWKIYGKNGAAALLGIKPTTLIERMKRKEVVRPPG